MEIDFVLDDASGARQVDEQDAVRARIHDRLAPLAEELWLTIVLTADRRRAL